MEPYITRQHDLMVSTHQQESMTMEQDSVFGCLQNTPLQGMEITVSIQELPAGYSITLGKVTVTGLKYYEIFC